MSKDSDFTIAPLVEALLTMNGWSREQLAAQLNVSANTVSRWQKGASQPRPLLEGKIRTLHTQLAEEKARYAVSKERLKNLSDGSELRSTLDTVLRELRETFHRRTRLSGRHESLDEVSKLLFAHVLRLANEGTGIDSLQGTNASGISIALKEFVDQAFVRYLPRSLAHEINPSEFRLRLLPQENTLAREIIECFKPLADQPKLVSADGIEAVDLLNEVFGKFLADSFTDEKQLGQYLTPTEVVRFMVQLALSSMTPSDLARLQDFQDLEDFGYVMDPSCGVGSFLAEFVRALHTQSNLIGEEESDWMESIISKTIVGIDKSERMIRYALTNIAMFGIPAAHLILGNALEKGPTTDQFDGKVGLILTNPPFGAEFSSSDAENYTIASKRSARSRVTSECLFLERYLEWLRPGGQLIAIVPDSILTNQGYFAQLRAHLADRIAIRNVISLPQNTFGASGTTTKTSILHLQRSEESERFASKRTLVSRCLDIGYSISTRNSHRIKRSSGPGDLPSILEMIRKSEPKGTNARWIEDLEKAPRWDANFFLAVGESVQRRLSARDKQRIRVQDVADLCTTRVDPRRAEGTFRYIEISDANSSLASCTAKDVSCSNAPSRARKLVRSGDVLVSTVRPERKTIAVVGPELDGAVCTTGFAVLRPRTIAPLLLAELLKTDFCTEQILRHNVGIAYPAVDEKCLQGVILPIGKTAIKQLNSHADSITALQEAFGNERREFIQMIMAHTEA